jgi:hypothetical protein
MPVAEKAEFDAMLVRMGDLSLDRNMVAHDLFFHPDDGDGIEFLVTKATGKLQFPNHNWTVDNVEQKSDELLSLRDKLKALERRLSYADLVRALIQQEDRKAREDVAQHSPIAMLFGQAPSDQADHQPPLDPGSLLQGTTDAKSPETPQEPQEK